MSLILIVEDDPRTAEKIAASVQAMSHTMVVTRSGEEGISHLKAGRFDLVVTDLMMEQGTGFDILDWLNENAPDLPVVICSSYARPESLRAHLAGRRHRIVRKPFRAEELAEAVAELLLEVGGPPAAAPGSPTP